MGRLHDLLFGKNISQDEMDRRKTDISDYSKAKMADPEKFDTMSENDKIRYWGNVMEEQNLKKRIDRMKPLAEAGFDAACYTIAQDLINLGEQNGSKDWKEIQYWLQKVDRIGDAHYLLALVMFNEENPFQDVDTGLDELCLAAKLGNEDAFDMIRQFCSVQNPELSDAYRSFFDEEFKAIADQLTEKGDGESHYSLALMYMYGVYFPVDYQAAKREFEMAAANDFFAATEKLESPLFMEDDE